MLVHTSVEKGFVYHLQFQNEASNGSFRLECNKSMFEGFFLGLLGSPLYSVHPLPFFSWFAHSCLHLQVITKQSNAVVIHLWNL